jgi:hypothetical protein
MRNTQIRLFKKLASLSMTLLAVLFLTSANAQNNQGYTLTVEVDSIEVNAGASVHIVGLSAGALNQSKAIENSNVVVFEGIQADTYDVFVITSNNEVTMKTIVELNANKQVLLTEGDSKK